MGSLTNILGAISPVLTMGGVPGAIIGTAGNLASQRQVSADLRAQQDLMMRQLQARQGASLSEMDGRAKLETQRLDMEAQAGAARRTAALRRAVGRQKTLFSAQGLKGGDGGSSEAVLLGLYDDNRLDQQADDQLTQLRKTALQQDLNATRQRNLLEATQLAQQQHLSRILKGY